AVQAALQAGTLKITEADLAEIKTKQDATAALSQYVVKTAEGIIPSIALSEAQNQLSAELKKGSSNADAIAAAFERVIAAAAKMGLTLNTTTGELEVLATAEKKAAVA